MIVKQFSFGAIAVSHSNPEAWVEMEMLADVDESNNILELVGLLVCSDRTISLGKCDDPDQVVDLAQKTWRKHFPNARYLTLNGCVISFVYGTDQNDVIKYNELVMQLMSLPTEWTEVKKNVLQQIVALGNKL